MSEASASLPRRRNGFGFDGHKGRDLIKSLLYKLFRIRLPKLRRQRGYWEARGLSYMDDFFTHGHAERELFFQNMIVEALRRLEFKSVFEAGCGFGWNIRRCREEFPHSRVGGVDYSVAHLAVNARPYLEGSGVEIVNGDNCSLPLVDDAFDVGFSLGVFMNIHPGDIDRALQEMIRVCRKHVLHVEWNASHAGARLREKRAPKTNIVSHDYEGLYRRLGQEVVEVRDHNDFRSAYQAFAGSVRKPDTWWAGYDGEDKYTYYLIRVCK